MNLTTATAHFNNSKLVEKYALPKGIQEEKISSCAREKFLSLVYELQTSKRVNGIIALSLVSLTIGRSTSSAAELHLFWVLVVPNECR